MGGSYEIKDLSEIENDKSELLLGGEKKVNVL